MHTSEEERYNGYKKTPDHLLISQEIKTRGINELKNNTEVMRERVRFNS